MVPVGPREGHLLHGRRPWLEGAVQYIQASSFGFIGSMCGLHLKCTLMEEDDGKHSILYTTDLVSKRSYRTRSREVGRIFSSFSKVWNIVSRPESNLDSIELRRGVSRRQ
jgi:hypothetical protein